jgi:2-haloacid dehalogenase
MSVKIKNVVFDFGGVLIDWNPRYLYREIFKDEARMEHFLSEICSPEWNEKQDAGRSFSDGIKELVAVFPEMSNEITLFGDRWDDMVGGEVKGTPEILYELKSLGFSLYGLTNWSGEKFPKMRDRFPFLGELEGIVVSGDEKLLKPDPAIFRILTERYPVKPEESLFIDDNPVNVEAGRSLGFDVIRFESAEQLRQSLKAKKIL